MASRISFRSTRSSATPAGIAGSRRGATTVEMAVVAPVFFLLVIGLVEFSRMAMFKQALTEAARAGCRKAVLATTRDNEQVDQAIREHLETFMSNSSDTDVCRVSMSPTDVDELERGAEITTAVEVDFSEISWMSPSFLTSHQLRSEVTMKRE